MAQANSTFALNAQTGQYVAEMGKAEKSTGKVDKSQKNMGKSAEKSARSTDRLTASIAKGRSAANQYAKAAAIAGVALTAAFVRSGLKTGDELAKISDKLGITTEKLAGLRHAAELTGVSSATMDTALEKLNVRMAEAATGTGLAVKSFEALGISSTELVKLSPDKAMGVIADKLSRVENSAQKAKIAYDIFGRSGVGLINTLQGGSKGLEELQKDAEAAGVALGRIDARQLEITNDEMFRVKQQFSGFSQQLAVKFAPVLSDIARKLFGVTEEAGGMGVVATKAFSFMTKAVGVFANGLHGLEIAWVGLKLVFQLYYNFVVTGLNNLTIAAQKMWNLLPWTDKKKVTGVFSGFLLTMESEIAKSQKKLETLLSKKLPSEAIEEYVFEVTASFEEEARAVQASQENVQGALITTEEITEKLGRTTKETAEKVVVATREVESAWDKALQGTAERIDSAFGEAWQGAFDSFSSFADSLKDAFKNLLAELAHLAITRPIIVSITSALGLGGTALSTGASAASGGGFGGISSLGSIYSAGKGLITGGVGAGISGLGTSIFSGLSSLGAGGGALASGLYNAGNSIATSSLVGGGTQTLGAGTAIGAGATLGAGLVGNFVGSQIFDQSKFSDLGGAGGAAAGAYIGTAVFPGVGTVVGALLGSIFGNGIGSIFGREKADLTTNTVDFGNNTNLRTRNRGHDFDEDAANLGDLFLALGNIVGATGSVGVGLHGEDGLRFNPIGGGSRQEFGGDFEGFFDAVFDDMVKSSDTLSDSLKKLLINFEGSVKQTGKFAESMVSISELIKLNPIEDALSAITDAQETSETSLFRVHQRQANRIGRMVEVFDGSAGAADRLNRALIENKAAAFEFALAVEAVGDSIQKTVSDSIQKMLEAVRTPTESLLAKQQEIDFLFAGLANQKDPAKIAEISNRLIELNESVFDAAPDDFKRDNVGAFVDFAQKVGDVASATNDALLERVRETQDRVDSSLTDLLASTAQSFDSSSDTMEDAANTMIEAANIFLTAVRPGSGGGTGGGGRPGFLSEVV